MKEQIFRMDNPIMNYAWGSHTAIANLLGQASPSEKPQAELWMGAHPKASSRVQVAGQFVALDQLIAQEPEYFLGAALSKKFSRRLPFLFKVLASAEPLSIQAHPSLQQARIGFAREETQGPPRDAPTRNFRDDNHKPELLCALSPFWAMAGLRPITEGRKLAQQLKLPTLLTCMEQAVTRSNTAAHASSAAEPPSAGAELWELLLRMPPAQQQGLLDELSSALQTLPELDLDRDPITYWLKNLLQAYPHDVGVLSPLLLQIVYLEPGEAIALKAGVLHAYLRGTGMEIMANSDNVLRGGLTPKHIDVDMLLKVLQRDCATTKIIYSQKNIKNQCDTGEWLHFDAGFKEFTLDAIVLQEQAQNLPAGLQILFCSAGQIEVTTKAGEKIMLHKGQSLFASAAFTGGQVRGTGQVYRAFVPQGL